MKKARFLTVATIVAAVFFVNVYVFSQNLMLLNSARDYCYIYSLKEKKILNKFKVCKNEASCTDVLPLKHKFIAVLHRLNPNMDAVNLYVYNADFSKLIEKIPVEQSPYRGFLLENNRVLINHTFFSYIKKKFVAELVNLKLLKVEKTLYLDGIPSSVVNLLGEDYAVIEDVRGVIKGVRLVSLKDNSSIMIKNPFLSSNIISVNGKLYCAVNSFGAKGYANSLFEISINPLLLNGNYSIKKLCSFKRNDPYILGAVKGFLVIGFTNHSIKNNYSAVCLFNLKSGKLRFFNLCFGPETMAIVKDKIVIGCLSKEAIAVIDLKSFKSKKIPISDNSPGFSIVRLISD